MAPKKVTPVKPAPTWRFELFHQVDRGNPNAGSDVHIDPDGKQYGMGKADYRPFIERCELVPPSGFDPLSAKLVFLPYFREQKPETTLGDYFKAQAIKGATLREMFPRDLEGFLRHPEDIRDSFSTLVEPKSQPMSLLVIWNPEGQWYVDEVFYRIEGIDGWQRQACSDVVEGSFEDFRRHFPLLQPRLDEGLSPLQHPTRRKHRFSADAPAIRLEKSPGMPNTRHYWLHVFEDGRFTLSGSRKAEVNSTDASRLTTLLIAASRLGEHEDFLGVPLSQAHDRQMTTFEFSVEGRRTRVTLGSDTPPDILRFMQQVAAAYGIGL